MPLIEDDSSPVLVTTPGQYVEPVHLQVVSYQLWENVLPDPKDMIARGNHNLSSDRAQRPWQTERRLTVTLAKH